MVNQYNAIHSQVWNFDADVPREEVKISTKGPVQRIEVVQGTILWSEQENIVPDTPDSSVGTVCFLVDPSNLNSIPIKVFNFYQHILIHIKAF